MTPETHDEIMALLSQMQMRARDPVVDRLSDELATLVRADLLPSMPSPSIRWDRNTMVVVPG